MPWLRGTPTPDFACTVTIRLTPRETPDRSIWELAVSHDPAIDPGGSPARSVDFVIGAAADYMVWFAFGCPFIAQVDVGP
jgi:hypothetical protein